MNFQMEHRTITDTYKGKNRFHGTSSKYSLSEPNRRHRSTKAIKKSEMAPKLWEDRF